MTNDDIILAAIQALYTKLSFSGYAREIDISTLSNYLSTSHFSSRFKNKQVIIKAINRLYKAKLIIRHRKANYYRYTLPKHTLTKSEVREIIYFVTAILQNEYSVKVIDGNLRRQALLNVMTQRVKRFCDNIPTAANKDVIMGDFFTWFLEQCLDANPLNMINNNNTPDLVKPYILHYLSENI